jgi:MFS family permease
MSPSSLPLTLVIVLAELAAGGLWVLLFSQARGQATPAFIKFCAAMMFVVAAIAFFVAGAVSVGDDVDGYPLRESAMGPARWALAGVFAASALYAYATIREHRAAAFALGGAASAIGLVALGLLARVVSGPTWGYPLVLANFVIGSLVVGLAGLGMTLGHWYLVTPRLPEKPLRELTGLLVVAMAVQALFLAPALLLPHDTVHTSVDKTITSNMFFYLRIGFGLAFPALLAWMSYDSAGVRAMQSSTGLLYIVMVLVICGEVVAKGLLFTSGVPT